MPFFRPLTDWLSAHSTILWWVTVLSLAALVLTPVIAAWLVVKLPPDYFAKRKRRQLGTLKRYPALRMALIVVKSALGAVLIIAGLLMLMTPGQGMLTIAVGLMLVEFPGKHRLERWLVTRPQVWRSMNWLRKRYGRQQLEWPRAPRSQ